MFYAAHQIDLRLGRTLLPIPETSERGLLFEPGTVHHYAMQDYETVERINSLGFRDREYDLMPGDAFRIVVIGDSFTYGYGVNLEEAWCEIVEARLNAEGYDVEVLNLGRPGAGPDDYAHIAESALPVLQPDLVLVGVLAGDDLRQEPDFLSASRVVRTYFPNTLQWLRARQAQSMGAAFAPEYNVEETRAMAKDTAQALYDDMSPEMRERFDALAPEVRGIFFEGKLNPWLLNHSAGDPAYFVKTLESDSLWFNVWCMGQAFKRIKRAAGDSPVLVLSIPEGFYVNQEAYENVQRIGFDVDPRMRTTTVPDDAVHDAAESAGVSFAAATDGFRERVDATGLYLELDRHFSPEGNRLYAELVMPAIRKLVDEHVQPRVDPNDG